MGVFQFPRVLPLLLALWAGSASGFSIYDTELAPNTEPAADATPETDSTPKALQPAPLLFTRTINGKPAPEEKKPEVVPIIITPFAARPIPVTPEKSALTEAAKTKDKLLPLEVVVNGAKSGTWLLLERGGNMYAPYDAFTEWRVQLSPDAKPIDYKFDGQEYWPLSSVPGYKVKMDFASQSAELLFSPEAFAATRMVQEKSKQLVLSPVLPSMFLNYDFNYSNTVLRNSPIINDLGVLAEIGASNTWGVLTNSVTGHNLTNSSAAVTARSLIRLETTFTRDYPNQNRTLRVGDSATRTGMWGRNVYFGGIQYGSNFALTPGFVSQPIPALTGVSTAPSTVQMYVNDVLRQVSDVPTGPFAIDNFPLLANSGDVKMVVRDILGRETVIEQSFFTSTDLLAKGLSDWSVEAGKMRRDLSQASNHYRTYFGSGTWRYGYNDNLTFEGRAELTSTTRTAGLGIVSALPKQILGQASLAISSGTGKSGGLWLLGLDRDGLHNSVSIQAQGAARNFRQLGQDPTILPIRLQLAGNWNYTTEKYGSFGMGLAALSRYDNTRITTVSSNFSTRIGAQNNLSFTASRAINGIDNSSIGLFLTMPLGDNRIVSSSATSHSGQQDFYVSALQNPGNDENLGWRALAGHQQGQARAESGLYYTGRYGKTTGDISLAPNQTALRLGASGGLVFADKNLFATHRVDQSFAITVVAGYKNIGIGLGSNVLTHTNARGVALIPRLIPYQTNSIRLDPSDLPISAEIDSIEENVVPAWRSAVKIIFPVRGGRAALLKIIFDDGEVAPAGATVNIEGDKQEFYVARRGEAFVTGLLPSNTVILNWNGQQCKIGTTLPPESPDEIARLGPLLCKGITR
ncbi:MAG: fimbrial biogenesis outer membrane usher protein [Gallionella sp.]|nr:fimbrial biogenesis outer membrane usher protein [Gallionella sp.]